MCALPVEASLLTAHAACPWKTERRLEWLVILLVQEDRAVLLLISELEVNYGEPIMQEKQSASWI